MDSFEDLGLSPELIEGLAAEGIERPTPLQEASIPVLRRGNNLLLAAGPGSGTLVAWGAAVLDRLDPDSEGVRVLVLTPTAESAKSLAVSLQRLAGSSGHSVAALGSPWVLPDRAQILFGTPADVLSSARGGTLQLGELETFVVDQASLIESMTGLDAVEEVIGFLPKEGQRIVLALPLTPEVESLVERHARRATVVPSQSSESPKRGALRYRMIGEPLDEAILEAVAEVLADNVRHVLLYARTEDRAADIGDYLTLHGFVAGAPGDTSAPVWLGVDELEARNAAEGIEGVVVVSADVPADPDSLDRRHGLGGGGLVLLLRREMAHLRDVARRTGYTVQPLPPRPRPGDPHEGFRETLARAISEEDIGPYLLLLEPLFEQFDPAEVAAAAIALLRKKAPMPVATQPSAPSKAGPPPTTWVKLFLSVGERDGLSAKDLVGAITGEARVSGGKLGKIEIKDSHSLVEVHEDAAQSVISALNGTTIRGRAVRADYDRAKSRQSHGAARGGPRGRPPSRRD